MEKVWTSKDGRRTTKITFTIERTTLEDKLTFLGSVVILGFVYYFFFKQSQKGRSILASAFFIQYFKNPNKNLTIQVQEF